MSEKFISLAEFDSFKRDMTTAMSRMEQTMATGGQFQSDKKVTGFEDVSHDIDTDLSHKAASYADREVMFIDKKLLIEREQMAARRAENYDQALKELDLAVKQHDFAVKQKEDALRLRSSEQAELVKNMINVEYAKVNMLASEPLAPNTGTSGNAEPQRIVFLKGEKTAHEKS